MPMVSVLLYADGSSAKLSESITSVLRQTWTDFELIVVDASTSNYEEQLTTLEKKDARVRRCRWRHGEDVQQLVSQCGGKYVAFQGSDGFSKAARLAVAVAACEADISITAVSSCFYCLGSNGAVLEELRPICANEVCGWELPLADAFVGAAPLLLKANAFRQLCLRGADLFCAPHTQVLNCAAKLGRLVVLEEFLYGRTIAAVDAN